MPRPKTYFRPTTTQQRHLLFQVWQATGSVTEACQRARVSRGTFYYWKKRFEEGGYAALEETEPAGTRSPTMVAPDVEALVIQLKQQHPAWGKLQISRQVQERLSGRTISVNTVRRILVDAGLWGASDR